MDLPSAHKYIDTDPTTVMHNLWEQYPNIHSSDNDLTRLAAVNKC